MRISLEEYNATFKKEIPLSRSKVLDKLAKQNS
jgi:hypothetical protein